MKIIHKLSSIYVHSIYLCNINKLFDSFKYPDDLLFLGVKWSTTGSCFLSTLFRVYWRSCRQRCDVITTTVRTATAPLSDLSLLANRNRRQMECNIDISTDGLHFSVDKKLIIHSKFLYGNELYLVKYTAVSVRIINFASNL